MQTTVGFTVWGLGFRGSKPWRPLQSARTGVSRDWDAFTVLEDKPLPRMPPLISPPLRTVGYILGDNGKEDGNYCNGLYNINIHPPSA